jgi:hypothetical protein
MCVKHSDELITNENTHIQTNGCASYCIKNIGGCIATLDNFTELRVNETICFDYFEGQTYCDAQPVSFPNGGTNPKLLVRKFYIDKNKCVQA